MLALAGEPFVQLLSHALSGLAVLVRGWPDFLLHLLRPVVEAQTLQERTQGLVNQGGHANKCLRPCPGFRSDPGIEGDRDLRARHVADTTAGGAAPEPHFSSVLSGSASSRQQESRRGDVRVGAAGRGAGGEQADPAGARGWLERAGGAQVGPAAAALEAAVELPGRLLADAAGGPQRHGRAADHQAGEQADHDRYGHCRLLRSVAGLAASRWPDATGSPGSLLTVIHRGAVLTSDPAGRYARRSRRPSGCRMARRPGRSGPGASARGPGSGPGCRRRRRPFRTGSQRVAWQVARTVLGPSG